MKKRYPVWEVSPFEAEHCYALHSSLADRDKSDEKVQICMDKKVLLKVCFIQQASLLCAI